MEKDGEPSSNNTKICFLSNYPPKECGISIFTENLTNSMNKAFNPKLRSRVIALNDPESHHHYNNKVIFQRTRNSPQEYIEIAQKINENNEIKHVCIQHEFGLFGGNCGEDILYFLNAIKKPVVVTFHSVLPHPNEDRKRIEKSKIYVIHHGTPNAKFISSDQYKKKLGLDGRTVIFTFGLLSRGKGIEYMIKALPPLVKKYPDLLYLIIGETHPVIRKTEGEKYRNGLIKL